MRSLKSTFRSFVVALSVALFAAAPIVAQAQTVTDRPTGLEMGGDMILVRPLTLAATVIGAGLFIVSLPFSALGGNVGEAGSTLVGTPFKSTFMRCLGCSQKHLPAGNYED
ncbi:hypothetical protein FT643_08185 [Ketobacter sp. MCCC 1A13808]|uniref:hypothetical protein n=1 Tax=Ketobacter sp. MCCC 1A13808 TaxID=2602738 RepID=UPI000F213491|nr:hypothetical protein [Ketobacter sp. MCCC 1A13808]MVF12122.1 hypothetical protein [Ketobacter sp. MCCC 1A13808]RLP53180.1 MAG: hypothetical protein D6160_16850 [Ketobacter sp.]